MNLVSQLKVQVRGTLLLIVSVAIDVRLLIKLLLSVLGYDASGQSVEGASGCLQS